MPNRTAAGGPTTWCSPFRSVTRVPTASNATAISTHGCAATRRTAVGMTQSAALASGPTSRLENDSRYADKL